jgi:hypothetical protein
MPSGGGRCEEHYRKEAGLPPLHSASGKEIHSFTPAPPAAQPEEKEEPMNSEDGRASKMDAAGMQRDRDAGMRVTEIAEKYKCHPASVYNHTHAPAGSGKKIVHRPSLAEKAAAALSTDGRHNNSGRSRKVLKKATGASGGYQDALEDLRTCRADMAKRLANVDRAIAALEELV